MSRQQEAPPLHIEKKIQEIRSFAVEDFEVFLDNFFGTVVHQNNKDFPGVNFVHGLFVLFLLFFGVFFHFVLCALSRNIPYSKIKILILTAS